MSSVTRNTVMHVLRNVSKSYDIYISESGDEVTIIKDGSPDVIIFPNDEEVPRKMLQRLQYKYGIPIHLFYHPENLATQNDTMQ